MTSGQPAGDDLRPHPHSGAWDALSHAGFGLLATWAWFLYGFGPLLPLLRAEEGTSRTVMGLHSLLMSGGAVLAALLTVPLVRMIRRRGVIRAGLIAALVGVLGLCAVPNPAVTLPAVALLGTGGAVLLNTINTAMAEHHGPSAPSVLSAGNAVAAGVGLIAPLAVGASVQLGWTWRPAALLTIVVAVPAVLLLRRVPRGWPALDGVDPEEPGPAPGSGRRPLGAPFWVALCLVTTAVGTEFICTAWSADLLRTRTALSPAAASAAVTLYVGGMFVGRALGGRLARTFATPRILLVALAVVLLGWVVLWLSTAPAPALAGLAVVGLGMSVQYPLTAALAYGAAPGLADRAGAALSFSVGLAAALAPFTIGAIADATSTHAAFLLVPVLVAVGVGLHAVRSRQAGRVAVG